MINIENLSVRFGGVIALDKLDLALHADITGLIGPNGAGKTTLTNVFSGFVTAASGAIYINGLDITALAPFKRARWGLARSFQKVQIVPDLTVKDHLHTVIDAIAGGSKTGQKLVDRALEFVGLLNCRDKAGHELNAFERRMTEIAKCLVGAPRVMLLDEPGGGLSETEMVRLRDVLKAIHPEFGAQILLVDHDVELIRDVCPSTAVLDFGKLIAFGETEDVLKDEVVKAAYLGR